MISTINALGFIMIGISIGLILGTWLDNRKKGIK
jgi:hypothetical protein